MDFTVDVSEFLTETEVAAVLRDGQRRAKRAPQTARALVIFRLATRCGLRASQIAGLQLRDLRVDSTPAQIVVPNAISKRRKTGRGKRRRPIQVPLEWSESTLLVLRDWKARRLAAGALPGDPVLCTRTGRPLHRNQVRNSFIALLRATGSADGTPVFSLERLRGAQAGHGLSAKSGRHTYASLALRAGHTLAEVSQALGHSSTAVTAVYTHATPEGFARRGELPGEPTETDREPGLNRPRP